MLLKSQKAYEMLQFSESKAYAHNQVISALLRHTLRHSGTFSFLMLSLELHEKTSGSQNHSRYIYSLESQCV